MRDTINIRLGDESLLAMGGFVMAGDPTIAGACLLSGTAMSGALGLHMTASIGGADIPVVITLLNSYSDWVLFAEGFILDQALLTVVGALIGSSGAFLTKTMCDGMNRDLVSVILGGFGTQQGAVKTVVGRTHKEIDVSGAVQALRDADKVSIIPGYGLAVAHAQSAIAEIALNLKKNGKR